MGDFNIWVDDIRNNGAENFLRFLNNFGLVNLVNKPTYNSGHPLDSVITKKSALLVKFQPFILYRNVKFHLNFNYTKVERKLIRFWKKNSSFPDNLTEKLDEKFSITQIDCHHTEFCPCVNSVTTKLKQLTRDVFEKCCSSNVKKILIRGKGNKWYHTEIKIAKRNMKHAEKKSRQDKTIKLKHNEFRWLRQLKYELVTRTKILYYKKKLKKCGYES